MLSTSPRPLSVFLPVSFSSVLCVCVLFFVFRCFLCDFLCDASRPGCSRGAGVDQLLFDLRHVWLTRPDAASAKYKKKKKRMIYNFTLLSLIVFQTLSVFLFFSFRSSDFLDFALSVCGGGWWNLSCSNFHISTCYKTLLSVLPHKTAPHKKSPPPKKKKKIICVLSWLSYFVLKNHLKHLNSHFYWLSNHLSNQDDEVNVWCNPSSSHVNITFWVCFWTFWLILLHFDPLSLYVNMFCAT